MAMQQNVWHPMFEGLHRKDFFLPPVLASALEDIGHGFTVNLDTVSAEDARIGGPGCYIRSDFVKQDLDIRQASVTMAKWWMHEGECSAFTLVEPC